MSKTSIPSAVQSDYLSGRVAVVTGGGGGIGQAICERFEREGAVVYAADISHGADAGFGNSRQLDVTSEASVDALFDELRSVHGKLDILVNAAGIEIEKTIEDTSLEEWNKVMAVNCTGMFLTARRAVKLMRKAGAGSIINFGSYDGFIADPMLAAYCASKGAVHALTKAMACDHGPENIRVNAVCPGYVDTPMLQSFFGSSGDIETLKQAVNDVLPLAEAFYQSLGKVTIRVKREVPAHVANRLQAALWREAISLVAEGVASVDDVDKAVWAGPGLRWAAMGPHQLFHLGAGVGGLDEFCQRYGDSFHRWWDDLGDTRLSSDVIEQLFKGVTEKSGDISTQEARELAHQSESNQRDQLIVAMLNSTKPLR